MTKIAVDAMGGDFAPVEIVKGAIKGAVEHNAGIILAGQQDLIKNELDKHDISGLDIEIIHTDEFVSEGESPVSALRNKQNASIIKCINCVKEGKAEAVVSAGPTGGIIISAIQILGKFEGISRPVLGGPFRSFASDTIILDMGSNIDCRPNQLVDFAILGSVFAEQIMNIQNPSVALLGIGTEEEKGSKVTREAYQLLKNSRLNFIGNIEGHDILSGKASVIVCDGFVGNILLKFCEGLCGMTTHWLKSRLSDLLPEDELLKITGELNYSMSSSLSKGGVLLGINGIVCKAHGRSKSQDISNIIDTAKKAAESGLVDELKSGLSSNK